MYRLAGGCLVLSPTDLVGSLYCDHLTELSQAVAEGTLEFPVREDAALSVLTKRGMAHERRYLERLAAEGLSIEDVSSEEGGGWTGDTPLDQLRQRAARTAEAMRSGVDVIYQATFFDERSPRVAWRGHADFLRRVAGSPDNHPLYEPDDTKLARHVRPGAVIQLCSYAERVGHLQGIAPENLYVVLGGDERVPLRFADFSAYHRAAEDRLVRALQSDRPETYPHPVEHCAICNWADNCVARRDKDDHLSLVAGLSREQTRKLGRSGIYTMTDLARVAEDAAVPRLAGSTLTTLRRQARLQVEQREAGANAPLPFEFLPLPPDGERRGFAKLPEPSPGDLFFDIEGDPFVDDGGLEYLLGIDWVEGVEPRYRAFWAHSRTEERQAFEKLVDFFGQRRLEDPDAHVYHYANYEPAAMLRLACRHATREDEVDDLLRSGAFVDLYRVLRESMAIGSGSYSLKKIEPLYMDQRQEDVIDAGASIEFYENWLETQDQHILDSIEEYNRVDCMSTRLLRDWLEARRAQCEEETGSSIARPDVTGDEESEEGDEDADVELLQILIDDLTGGADVPPEDDAHRARWVTGHLLNWHRREAKSEWRTYFERVNDYGDQDFLDDLECLGGLVYTGTVGVEKKSTLHRYGFDPGQECKLTAGDGVLDPLSELKKQVPGVKIPGPGTLVEINSDEGWLTLKRGTSSAAPHPTNLIAGKPIGTAALQAALLRLGEFVRDNGIDASGPWRAVRDLLMRQGPRRSGGLSTGVLRRADESPEAAVSRLVQELDQGCLAVQGPPGTGKTSTAGEFVVDLVEAGKRVGVMATSHAVISNLLDSALRSARQSGKAITVLQRCDPERSPSTDPGVRQVGNAAEVVSALDQPGGLLVGGTAWLFATESLHERFDYLVIDEASQISLANVAAAAGAARNLVLVGDPQQLAQPSKGMHPPLCGSSALEYLLAGHDVMSPEQGLFLDHTHRLHPEICRYISELSYLGKLETDPECAAQTVAPGPLVEGSGIRWAPVDHEGNKTSSDEEAMVVRSIYAALLGRPWTNKWGVVAPLDIDEILVVAPYNAQVARIRHHLSGVVDAPKVGTVDKFQGQQAAVVIVSMAASSAEDVPRGMEFLYSRNRLNVAVSRAMATAVVVASPVLLAAHCRSIEQLRLANGFCRLVEVARTVQ
jgi:predicted RecB family nuclease